MTIEKRIQRLETIDEFATKPLRGIMYICDDAIVDEYTLTVGKHTESIRCNQNETQAIFYERACARMESFYQSDKNAPVAFLHPELREKSVGTYDS